MDTATTSLPVIPLQTLAGNPVPHLDYLQQLLVPYTDALVVACWFLWFCTLFYVLRHVYLYGVRGGDSSDRELYDD